MKIRTDIAAESNVLVNSVPDGVYQNIETINNLKIIRIKIQTQEGSNKLGRPIGNYITLESPQLLMPENIDSIQSVLVKELDKFIVDKKSVLIIGLGNKNITPDAIGPSTAENIIASRHFKGELEKSLGLLKLRSVSVMAPGVLGQTGIETAEIIKSISNEIKPDLVIAIDALAARSLDRLGTTIQLTDSGISPGSGVENKRAEISEKTLNIPVVAIGMPTVVDMQTIALDICAKGLSKYSQSMMVTPRNIDQIISRSSLLLFGAINQALFPSLSAEELNALCS